MTQRIIPSLPLLRAYLRPSVDVCTACQTRSTSSFMPREKYVKVNRLDKLHRTQKAALQKEKEATLARAVVIEETMKAVAEKTNTTALPFHIGRTRTNNLPIYELSKGGGNKHITRLRILSGDLDAMRQELRTILRLPEITIDAKGRKKEPVAVNQVNQHIIIKGWRAAEVKKWAEALGF